MKPNTLLTIIGITLVLIGLIGALSIEFQPTHKTYEKKIVHKYHVTWDVKDNGTPEQENPSVIEEGKIYKHIVEIRDNNLTNVSFHILISDNRPLGLNSPAVHIVIKAPNGTTEVDDVVKDLAESKLYTFVIANIPNDIVIEAKTKEDAEKKISAYSSTNGTGTWIVEISFNRDYPAFIRNSINAYIDEFHDYYIANITKITTGAV